MLYYSTLTIIRAMKYLLVGINAKYIHSNLALYSMRAYAKKYAAKSVDILEYTINMPISDIVKGIYNEKPDVLGISVYIWNISVVSQLLFDLHILLPQTKILLGGPEVSYESENFLKQYPFVSAIMQGEGEQTLCELISHYENGQPAIKDINGICYIDSLSNAIVTTPARKVLDLSTVPFAYEDLSEFKNRIIYYETSRGCPFGCSYCLSSVEKSVRFRSMEQVKAELNFFMENRVAQVKLVDRTFNIDHKRSLEMINFLKENDNGITNFHFEIAGDILTDEEIDIINSLRPGLVQLEIGVQSTNEETLCAINRKTDLEKLSQNVERLLEGGKVHLHLDLIAGLPFEDKTSFIKSFNEVYSMQSHELQLGFLKVLKGAPIHQLIDSQKIQYSPTAPYEVLSTKLLSYDDICELKRVEEMLEIYHNSCQFLQSEKFLLEYEKSPYDMYLGLANYYNEKNQPVIQCKRAVRYELFLDYAVSSFHLDSKQSDLLRHYLTMDYYSREKAKARPAFATPIDEYKKELRQISDAVLEKSNATFIHVEPLLQKDSFAVFNYDKRSPITGNAQTDIISDIIVKS